MLYTIPREETTIANKTTKISVIVPCYNAEKYLDRCIKSILIQTIGIENIEIVLVNDASIDGTMQLLEKYERKHPEQILVINCEKNGKQGTARNIGMQYASGEYITFVDADDEIAPDMLEELYKGILKWNTEVSECNQIEVFDGEKKIGDIEKKEAQLFLIETGEERRAFFLSNAWACGPIRRLYQKDFLWKYQIDFLENTYMEDMYFTYLVLAHCRSWYRISDPLYYYYQNRDSVMHSTAKKTYYMDVHNVFKKTVDRLKEDNVFCLIREELEYVYFRKVFYDLSSFVLHTFDDPTEKGIAEMETYLENTFSSANENQYMSEQDRKDYQFLKNIGRK